MGASSGGSLGLKGGCSHLPVGEGVLLRRDRAGSLKGEGKVPENETEMWTHRHNEAEKRIQCWNVRGGWRGRQLKRVEFWKGQKCQKSLCRSWPGFRGIKRNSTSKGKQDSEKNRQSRGKSGHGAGQRRRIGGTSSWCRNYRREMKVETWG